MGIEVRIPLPLRSCVGGKDVLEASGGTVGAVLEDLSRRYPSVVDRFLEEGSVRRFVNVYLNDQDIRFLDHLLTPVQDGDRLSLVAAIAGG